MEHPFFSIVIPVYNTNKELPRCVNSVLLQTYGNYEIVLVDDGSTDGSGLLCDQYAESDTRVRCIHKENAGASEARNTGVQNAAGEYILFLDSDDYWDDENALSDIYQIICDSAKPDVVCFGVEIIGEDGTLEKIRKPRIPAGIASDKESILRHLVMSDQYFSASYVKVANRQFLQEHGIYFVKGLVSGEDIEWSGRVMVACQSIAVYPSIFYKRIRRSSGSITSQIKTSNLLDVLTAIDKGVRYVKERETNPSLLEIYYSYWAYQYAMLFVLAGRIQQPEERSAVLSEMETYKWLLKYSGIRKVRMVKWLTNMVGMRNVVLLLCMLKR